jgi:hypothetical protein
MAFLNMAQGVTNPFNSIMPPLLWNVKLHRHARDGLPPAEPPWSARHMPQSGPRSIAAFVIMLSLERREPPLGAGW